MSLAVGIIPLTVSTLPYNLLTEFTIMDTPTPYNMIVGLPWLDKLRTVSSTYHQVLRYSFPQRVMEIRGNRRHLHMCEVAATPTTQTSPGE